MKSVAKVGIAILVDLIHRLRLAGPRESLAAPLDWEAEEGREYVYLTTRVAMF